MCKFVAFVALVAAVLINGSSPATNSPLRESLACVHRRVNEAKEKWSVHARPIFTFDVCAFLKEANLTKCPESIVSSRLAKKLDWYTFFVCERRDAYFGQVLVCEGVDHGARDCSDYHQKRLAFEESIRSRCSNKLVDGSDGSHLNNETIGVLKEIHALETLEFHEQQMAEHPQKDPDMCSDVFAQLLFIDGSSVRLRESSHEDVDAFD